MGLASAPAPPRPPSLAREISATSSKLISTCSTPSMSQDFHQSSNIFSFSDEFHERPPPQQHHRGRERLRQVQGFEDSTAVVGLSITGNTLQAQAPMVEEAEEEEEEEEDDEEVARAYGAAPSTAGATNILSEMFNFPGAPADLLACQNSPPRGYQRLQQKPAAGFLGAPDSWPPAQYAGNRLGPMISTSSTGNWVPLEDAAAVARQDGDMINSDSSTPMRHFFMDPQSTQAARQHQWQPNSPPADDQPGIGAAAVVPLHHPQASHHNQGFLGAAYGFSGGGESVIENQRLSLSLSSSLRQLGADQELSSAREAAAGTLFFNNQLHHHDQAEQHQLFAHPLQIIRQGQQQQQQVHMVMGYGGGGCLGPLGVTSVMSVLRNSKYVRATQELLEEFCSVGRGGQYQVRSRNRTGRVASSSINPNTSSGHVGGGGASTSASAAVALSSSSSKDITPPLSAADRFENQRKKSKLLSILEEVDRRYNHYCEQMQMVVNSFDSVMGLGAATPYTALAQKAMSRHFRCLKDAVAAQLKHTCELLGDRDGAVGGSGLTKGETPKLRLIDQSLRQQRAFHQMGMMEQEAWRPQRGLPDRSVTLLRAWLFEHFLHPYPSDADKHLLARQTGLSRNQVSNWFINARVRLWKPMVEEMYQQEAREGEPEEDEEEEEAGNKYPVEETANRRAMSTQQQQQSPENHLSSAPIPTSQPRDHDDAATLVFAHPALHDAIYAPLRGSAAAPSASGRGSGDLSLTLGLRHAGGNAPDAARFGKC